jgi:hypothetical protein
MDSGVQLGFWLARLIQLRAQQTGVSKAFVWFPEVGHLI